MDRFAIATNGYLPAASFFRQLIATNGYWGRAIQTTSDELDLFILKSFRFKQIPSI